MTGLNVQIARDKGVVEFPGFCLVYFGNRWILDVWKYRVAGIGWQFCVSERPQ